MTKKKKRLKRGRYEQLAYIGIILGIILLLVGGIGYGILQYRYSRAQATYEELSSEYVVYHRASASEATPKEKVDNTHSQDDSVMWYDLASVDYISLKANHKNVVGWLYFEDGTINYPIMYSDNELYLTHSYDGNYSASGSIFMDVNNHTDWDDPFTIIYGHNMKDGSMFRPLKNYQTEEYLNVFPYFQIITADTKYRYQICAVNTISMFSDYYDISYSRDSLLDDRISKICRESSVPATLIPSKEDYILNLSTCSDSDNRLFVTAVRVDSHTIMDESE